MRSIFLKGLWRQRRNYGIVLLCGVLQVSIMFLVNALGECLSVIVYGHTSNAVESHELELIFALTDILLFFLLVLILISYIRKRAVDYEMLENLGMKRKHKRMFIAAEFGVVILISIAAGVVLGWILSALLKNGLEKLFYDSASQIYYGDAPLRRTVITALLLFGAIFIFFDEAIALFGMEALLQFGKGGGKKYKRSLLSMLTGTAMILLSLICLGTYWGKTSESVPIFFSVIGLYLVMKSVVVNYLLRLKKKERKYFKRIIWLNNWYHNLFYNLKTAYIIAAFLFIINFSFSLTLLDNLPVKMLENYPYDLVWLANQEDQGFIEALKEQYELKVEEQPCIRVTTGDTGEQIGISASYYEKWTGKRIDLKDKEIYVVYQRERGEMNFPGIDHNSKTPRLYMGPSRPELWAYVAKLTLPGPEFEEDFTLTGCENRVLTGVFQDYISENIIVFSDEYYEQAKQKEGGEGIVAMMKIEENYEEAAGEIYSYINDKNGSDYFGEALVYEKDEFLLAARHQHLLQLAAAGINMLLLFLCGVFIFIMKVENDLPEMEEKYKLYMRSGMSEGKQKKSIWKEVASSSVLALLFGLTVSSIFVVLKIYLKNMEISWVLQYLVEIFSIILGVTLIFAGIVTADTWKISKKMKRGDEHVNGCDSRRVICSLIRPEK